MATHSVPTKRDRTLAWQAEPPSQGPFRRTLPFCFRLLLPFLSFINQIVFYLINHRSHGCHSDHMIFYQMLQWWTMDKRAPTQLCISLGTATVVQKIFYWSIVDFQYCVNTWCTVKGSIYLYIYFFYILLFICISIMVYYKILNTVPCATQ